MSTPHIAPEDADKFAAQFKPAWDDEPSVEKPAAFSPGVTLLSASHEGPPPSSNGTNGAAVATATQAPVEPPKPANVQIDQGPSVVLAADPAPEAPSPPKGQGMTMRMEPGMMPALAPRLEAAPAPIVARPAVDYDEELPRPRPKSKLPLIVGSIVAVLALSLGAVFAFSGGSKDSSGDTLKPADKPADKAPAARTDLPKVDPPKDEPRAADPPKDEPKPKAPARVDAPAPATLPAPAAVAGPMPKPGPAAAPKDPPAAPAPKKPGKPGGIVRDNPF